MNEKVFTLTIIKGDRSKAKRLIRFIRKQQELKARSLHPYVRQAALAAVGVGWSWVHQVPTVFPFTCFDACLSLATLSIIPPNSTTQNDAVYDLYSIVCANLSQSTRNFLFSRFVLQCQACLRSSAIPIDTFTVTIKPDTSIDELCDLLVPIWNTDELTECQACPCLDVAKAKWKCGKLGPLIIARITVPPGVSFPKFEEERLPLGHKFMFQEREYEIQCLIATTRFDVDSQLMVLHTSQPGMISVYDHNNGIRVVDSKLVSGKLLISGLVILPVKSPKAILMTKQLSEAAGGGEVAQYRRRTTKGCQRLSQIASEAEKNTILSAFSPVMQAQC